MEQKPAITTLIFDFGGVLINLDLSRCVRRFKALGFDDIDRYLGNFGQSEFFLQYEKGEIDTPRFRDEIRQYTRLPLTDSEIDEAWCAFLLDIPQQKLDLLAALKDRYRLLLLSNTNPLHIERAAHEEFARHGKTIRDFFHHCYLSYEMGLAKPQPEIFEAVLRSEGLRADECLFLDDGAKNIEQAGKLGLHTYLVDPKEDLSFLLTIDR